MSLHLLSNPLPTPLQNPAKINGSTVQQVDNSQKKEFSSPLTLYDHRIAINELKNDNQQRAVIQKLEDLHSQAKGYTPTSNSPRFFSKLFGSSKDTEKEDAPVKYSDAPKGLYLYGSVGCGKTMLMDLLYDTCHIEKKQRVHFHEFMMDVHQRIHAFKKTIPRQYNVHKYTPSDPIPPVATSISEETWFLCFDEFQVTDIADAMILKRLFAQLWRRGVIVVATSNRRPDDLYKNGLQRLNFLPFIPMLKANNIVINLDTGIDYRRQTLPAEGHVYFVHSEWDSKYEMDLVYEDMVGVEKAEEGPKTLTVLGRQLYFPKTCGTLVDCTFDELCKRPIGASDYIEICRHFDTVLIRDIPHMTLEKKNEARRFITLIDTLYDHRVRVVCSAEASPDNLFAKGEVTDYDRKFSHMLIGDLDIKKGDANETASLFTGEEELFAFERVASRLTEMQSAEYWKQRALVKEARKKKPKKTDS